jgi:hypothetical protein
MKSIELTAPTPFPSFSKENEDYYNLNVSIFLAGSIENGVAEMWQDDIIKHFPEDVLFFNPRRADWDKTWDHNTAQFDEQVWWELQMLDLADVIVMYFDPNTKSPISLLELGLYADSRKLIVCCPDGYWRQGNVRIVCEAYNIPYFTDKQEWIKKIEEFCA